MKLVVNFEDGAIEAFEQLAVENDVNEQTMMVFALQSLVYDAAAEIYEAVKNGENASFLMCKAATRKDVIH